VHRSCGFGKGVVEGREDLGEASDRRALAGVDRQAVGDRVGDPLVEIVDAPGVGTNRSRMRRDLPIVAA
jgi:hypothetical protein